MMRRIRSTACAASLVAMIPFLVTAPSLAIPPSMTYDAPTVRPNPPQAGGPFDSVGVMLRSFLTPQQMSPAAFGGNGCWGYVSPSGREYAIVGLDVGTAFVEITDPVNPDVIVVLPDNASTWSDLKVFGHYAYNVNENPGDGIQIFNMQNIDGGVVTLVQEYHGAGINEAHTIAVNPDSGFLYALGANSGGLFSGGLIAYDLTDPANPVFAGAWSDHYCHDAQIVTYTSGPYAGMEIAFCFAESSGFYVIDATTKNAMSTMSLTTYPQVGYCHQGWLSDDRQYLYIDDELDETQQGVPTTRTLVFDVGDLTDPQLVNSITTGFPAIDHNLYVKDGIIYEANYTTGLQIFYAVDNQVDPVHMAYFDTHPESNGLGFSGAWSNYPFFPSGSIIVSDIDRGLFVLDLDENLLRFSFPNGRPAFVPPFTPTNIAVHVEDFGSAVNASTAVLRASVDGGMYTSYPMTHLGAGEFQATLPGVPCGSDVEYYVAAENMAGTEYSEPVAAPSQSYAVDVIASVTTVFADDFELAQAWTASAADCPSVITDTGVWQRVDPVGTAAAPENDYSDPGTTCFVTANGMVGGSLGAADVDGGPFVLTSPSAQLDGEDALISYARWFYCDDPAPFADFLTVEVSTNGGGSWLPAEVVGSTGPQWVQHQFRLSDVAPPGANVRVRFSVVDCPNDSVTEAAIDEFEIATITCPSAIPTVSQWGLVMLSALFTTAGTIVFAGRRAVERRQSSPLPGD